MTYSVTSWFVDQAVSENPPVKRTFTIAGSDYSAWVLSWPTITTRWDELSPNNATISLANEDQTFNFFKSAKVNVQAACAVKFGFTHPTSGDELITFFNGTVAEVNFKDGQISLRLVDKLQKLSDRIIGTSNSAAVFSTSTLLPSDIAWIACTSYGGLSAVASTSNPDINYASFAAWAAVFSADSVYMQASFTGQKVTEALRKVAQSTQSAAYMANDKLTFARWSTANTSVVTLNNDHIKSLGVKIRGDAIVNKQWVEFSYNTTSKSWGSSVFAANSASINSYGTRETVQKDESIWYVSSSNALNMAQRSLQVAANPYDEVELSATLAPLYQTVGDTIIAVDNHLDVTAGWRIMSTAVNIDTGGISLSIDGSQINTPFLLDVSSLDGPDLLL
jgi:hypothetical protein